MTSRAPNEIDKLVARNIHYWRHVRGIKQVEISYQLGISANMLKKYENGKCRISAGRLYGIAKGLNVSIGELFSNERSMLWGPYESGK